MDGDIYVVGEDGRLVPLRRTPYESEDALQALLARYPALLAGEQVDPAAPRRWLLVRREAGVPLEEGGGGWFALDHLFLDQDGIPTLVEVKRATDTRTRREVVAQMLDYAANGILYWPVETLRAEFESRCESEGHLPDEVLAEVLGTGTDSDAYWQQVKTNLQAGRVRLVFVADEVPRELQRVVEFLNTQMDPAQVLALEVQQYVGTGLRVLVPRVLGQPATARPQAGAGRPRGVWDEATFFTTLEALRGPREAAAARVLYQWAAERQMRCRWGTGTLWVSCTPEFERGGLEYHPFTIWFNGQTGAAAGVTIPFGYLRARPPFDDAARRQELLTRLNAIPGVAIPADAADGRYPSIPLATFTNEAALDQFLTVMDWLVQEADRA